MSLRIYKSRKYLFGFIYLVSLFLFSVTSLFALEVVVDNSDSGCTVSPPYSWQTSNWGGVYGLDKLYTTKGDGSKTVTWTALLTPGRYRVQAWVNAAGYAADAHYTIFYGTNSVTLVRSQFNTDSGWSIDLGTFDFDTIGQVMLSDYWTGPEQYIVADAIKFVSISSTGFNWSANSIPDALATAKSANKPILVYFSTEKASDAQKMDAETFTDPTVVKWADRFSTVHIKVDQNPDQATAYNVYRVPVIIFLDSSGKEISRIEGFIVATSLVEEMNKALAGATPKPE